LNLKSCVFCKRGTKMHPLPLYKFHKSCYTILCITIKFCNARNGERSMNIKNINVNKYPISQMLDPESKIVFEIPKYQREYIWGTRQWEQLFDDLIENSDGYFLGSIICINTTVDSINSPKFEVVDGQQRLTTISIFLTALYSELNALYDDLDEDQQADVLQIKRRLVLKKTTADIRIIPQVQNHNYADYMGLLAENGLIPPHKYPNFAGNRRIVQAHRYFKKRIQAELEEAESKVAKLFEILDKINSAILVMIDVSNHADAYTLFESLNNRGTPLTAVDLIKNLLLSKLDVSDNENLDYYFTRWTEVIDYVGDEYSVQERFFRQNYNAFRSEINKPFIKEKDDRKYPLGPLATRSTMLDLYERMVSHNPKEFLETMLGNAKIYSGILLRSTDDMTPALQESYLALQRVQGAPSYLLMLYFEKNREALQLQEADIIKINNLLVRFFVRRNLTDTPPTRDLTRLFMAFIEELEQNGYVGDAIYTALRSTLLAVSASDDVFEEKLRGSIYAENQGVTRFVLCTLAQKGMTMETQVDLWRMNNNNQYVWTIEHIFPQGHNIPDCWVDMIAGGDTDRAHEIQTLYVHTLGNLTITGYNSTLSNRPFEDKKTRKDNNGNYIGYLNGINLNADVCDKDAWTLDIIKERTNRLVKEILDTFQL